MKKELRLSGIKIVGNIPWGTHFCHFYRDKTDLRNIVVPYIKEGLKNNEFCMWITGSPEETAAAIYSLKQVVDLNKYIRNKQVEITDYKNWYLTGKKFQLEIVLKKWLKKKDYAIKRGFDGIRVTGDTSWLENKDWPKFNRYENLINEKIKGINIMVLCSYFIDKCDPYRVMDIVSCHQFSLVHQKSQLKIIHNYVSDKITELLETEHNKLKSILDSMEDLVYIVDDNYNIQYTNIALEKKLGKLGKKKCYEYLNKGKKQCSWCKRSEILRGDTVRWEWYYPRLGRIYDIIETPIEYEENKVSKLKIMRDITEYKNILNSLEKSEERYALAQEAANIGSWDWNIVTGGLEWSDTIESIFGFAPGEFGKTYEAFLQCVHPDDRKFLVSSVNNCVEKGSEYKIEHRIIWPDKTVHWVSETGDVIRDKKGKAIRMLGIVMDITERKTQEEMIRKIAKFPSENPNPIIRVNHDGQILYSNTSGLVVLEYWQRKVGQSIPNNWIKVISRVLTKKSSETFDIEIKNKTFSMVLKPIIEDSYVNVYGFDITDRKKMETVIIESEEKFRKLIENTADPIIRIDRNMKFAYINPAAVKEYQISHKILIGKNLKEIMNTYGVIKGVEQGIKSVFDTRKERIIEANYNDLEETKHIQFRIVPEFSLAGQVESVICISRDITNLKKVEHDLRKDKLAFEELVRQRTQELMVSKIELEKAKRLSDIGTLAATVAHELRNPLGVIRTASYNIRRKSKDNIMDKHINNIEKKIDESNQIINNLLFYSRLKMPQYSEIKIYDILTECINHAKNKYRRNDINVDAKFGEIKNVIEADQYQVNELFNNVIGNAFESFIDRQGTIKVKTSENQNTIEISVEDEGTGIDETDLKNVFEPFFTKKSKGTGLGLTVCKQIAELHGGNINLTSLKDKGTTVTVTLPVRRQAV